METVKIEGLRELGEALDGLGKATARNTLRRVLRKQAEPFLTMWKGLAPRDEGRLEKSIIVGTRLTRRQARDAKADGKHFAEVHIGTADPAGVQQEFGNINHPAQPSGRPAWESTRHKTLDGIADELRDEIERVRARAARKAARLLAKE